MKQKDFKRCPRCDCKVPLLLDRCTDCGLIFSRMSKVTNVAAKKALKKKEYNKVIYDKVLPKDLNKWKLFLWGLFFGWFGMHYLKVGRIKMTVFMIISFILITIAAILPMEWFNDYYLSVLMYALILPASFSTIMWIVSLCEILSNRFKVPVAIDEDYVVANLDKKVVEDVLKTAKSDESEEKIQENKEPEKIKTTKTTKTKREKIKRVCKSCGMFVKVYDDEKICPKCDEPLDGD